MLLSTAIVPSISSGAIAKSLLPPKTVKFAVIDSTSALVTKEASSPVKLTVNTLLSL